MNWKAELKQLEDTEQWDAALDFAFHVVAKYPNDEDAYLFVYFLLNNLIGRYDHPRSKELHELAKKYCAQGNAKFANSAAYIFFTAKIAMMISWRFGFKRQDYDALLQKAVQLDPHNMLYRDNYYKSLDLSNPNNGKQREAYVHMVLEKDSAIQQQLATKGSLGEYLLRMMLYESKKVLGLQPYYPQDSWKALVRDFELAREWDTAIALMQDVIADNPDDVEPYIFMNYLLMNLLVEEEHSEGWDREHYEDLALNYFNESYKKFSENPEYLFYTGLTAVMAPWYFGIDQKDYDAMCVKAILLEPGNLLYRRNRIIELDLKIPEQKEEAVAYAKIVLSSDSPIRKMLATKGSVGEYIWAMMRFSSKCALGLDPYA